MDRSFYFYVVKVSKLITLISFCILIGCSRASYEPDDQLSKEAQDNFKWKIIRFAGRSPESLTFQERFYPQYDSHYREQQFLHILEAYYEKDEVTYFMLSRKAPSLFDKRVAIGGVVKFNVSGEISYYEEIYRTWKMNPDTLKRRSGLLFAQMVEGKSLEPYYTKNSNGIEYIEFPDDRTVFDVKERIWKLR